MVISEVVYLCIAEPLRHRCRDSDESVRMDVVTSIIGAVKKDVSGISMEHRETLLQLVKDRTLDKKVGNVYLKYCIIKFVICTKIFKMYIYSVSVLPRKF